MMFVKQKPNVIVIMPDGFRSGILGCHGYHRNTSPNIDKFSEQSVLFRDCYSVSYGTDPCLTSIFTGKHPINHGIIRHGDRVTANELQRFDSSGTKLLAQILKSHGYHTIGIDWFGRWHRRGYDYYWGDKSSIRERVKDSGRKIVKSLPAPLEKLVFNIIRRKKVFITTHNTGDAASLAIEKMSESPQPFFMFLHMWGTHSPFRVPQEFFEKFDNLPRTVKIKDVVDNIQNEEYREKIRNSLGKINVKIEYMGQLQSLYEASVYYIDFQIGRILEFLRTKNLIDNSIIIITGDHGAPINRESAFLYHHGLFEEMIRVPLIIKYGSRFSKRVNGLVQSVDITPTILDIVGIDTEKYGFDGHSLLPSIQSGTSNREFVYMTDPNAKRFAISDGKHKFIHSKHKAGATCWWCNIIHEGAVDVLFDLQNDRGETENHIDENVEKTDLLKKELLRWLSAAKNYDPEKEMI